MSEHLRAWFVDPATKMNPNLEYAQAIFGVSKGRGTGIIDTLHLVEVVRALRVMEAAGGMWRVAGLRTVDAVRAWFAEYVDWMATSKNGIDERDAKNNHGTCWVLQVAEFSQFAQRPDLTALCVERFKTAIVPDQIAKDGSLPLELARTKPYSYSLVRCGCAERDLPVAIDRKDDLWEFKGPNGAGVARCGGVSVSVYRGQIEVAVCEGCGVLRRSAGAAAEPAVCGRGAGAAGVYRRCGGGWMRTRRCRR